MWRRWTDPPRARRELDTRAERGDRPARATDAVLPEDLVVRLVTAERAPVAGNAVTWKIEPEGAALRSTVKDVREFGCSRVQEGYRDRGGCPAGTLLRDRDRLRVGLLAGPRRSQARRVASDALRRERRGGLRGRGSALGHGTPVDRVEHGGVDARHRRRFADAVDQRHPAHRRRDRLGGVSVGGRCGEREVASRDTELLVIE